MSDAHVNFMNYLNSNEFKNSLETSISVIRESVRNIVEAFAKLNEHCTSGESEMSGGVKETSIDLGKNPFEFFSRHSFDKPLDITSDIKFVTKSESISLVMENQIGDIREGYHVRTPLTQSIVKLEPHLKSDEYHSFETKNELALELDRMYYDIVLLYVAGIDSEVIITSDDKLVTCEVKLLNDGVNHSSKFMMNLTLLPSDDHFTLNVADTVHTVISQVRKYLKVIPSYLK